VGPISLCFARAAPIAVLTSFSPSEGRQHGRHTDGLNPARRAQKPKNLCVADRVVELSRATQAGNPVEPLVEAICIAPDLAAGHCEIAPRAPRAVLLPEFSGLDHGIAHPRHGSFRGGITSIRPLFTR
jgi:hypothetical protein